MDSTPKEMSFSFARMQCERGGARQEAPHPCRRHGQALEFYDFVTSSFFAVYIRPPFSPQSPTRFSLLASLATFGVGFIMRPVGAYGIGRLGDRVGCRRRRAR